MVGGSAASAEGVQLEPLSVTSPTLQDGGPLPSDYSCHGSMGNPPLRWSRVPDDAKSVAIVVDNNNSRTGAEVHWVVLDIDPRTNEVAENTVPVDAVEGRTTNGKVGYTPPCRRQENYRFTVYALKGKVDLDKGAPSPRLSGASRT
nr:hypothetical protein GCM10020093_041950 [Planobispora longispora]